jgi:2,3-diketo-5-methylthiopentyl-1-phosphate enolase
LKDIIDILHSYNVLPALSCGMHPGIVKAIESKYGIGFMANTGGAIHGHPNGSIGGATAMRSAIDGNTDCPEYKLAIEKWGLMNG